MTPLTFHVFYRSPANHLFPFLAVPNQKYFQQIFAEEPLRWWRANAPIGSRGTSLKHELKQFHVDSIVTGCLTLTLDPLRSPDTPQHGVIIGSGWELVQDKTGNMKTRKQPKFAEPGLSVEITQHLGYEDFPDRLNWKGEFRELARAFGLLKRYAEAELVVTHRLHSALPSIGQGTRAAFMASADVKAPNRFSGLMALLPYNMSMPIRRADVEAALQYPVHGDEQFFRSLRTQLSNVSLTP